MNNLKIVSWLLLIIPYSYDSACHSYNDLKPSELLNIIQNTPNPSPKLLNSWLTTAFKQANDDAIKYLLFNTPINLNYQDKDGNSWLHYAAALGNPEIVKILLTMDIERNVRNIFGNTALHDNAKYNPNLKIIKMLFMTGVNPDLKNYEGQKALDLYLAYNSDINSKIVIMLKKHCICYFVP